MEIYLEYALLENFFVDGALLFLSALVGKRKIVWGRLVLSAAIGAAFAVLFPLLPLPMPLSVTCKFLLPILLCKIAIKKENGGGGYALTLLFFYAFSFAFAGLLYGVFGAFDIEYFEVEGGGIVSKLPVGGLLAALVFFVALCLLGVKKLYEKRRTYLHIYDCEIVGDRGVLKAKGYLDTGNTASYHGMPVCFVTPDLFYDFTGGETPTEQMTVVTLAGEKRVSVIKAEKILVGESVHGVAYLSPTSRLIGREYKILLPRALADEERKRRTE